MTDKNEIEIKTGDVVRISGAYFKVDNGLYFIDRSPGDPTWSGEDYSLIRISKSGKISTAKNHVAFWPLMTFVNNREKGAAADAWNAEHAEIEIQQFQNMDGIIDHFRAELTTSRKWLEKSERLWGEDSPDTVQAAANITHFSAVLERLGVAEEATEQEIVPAAPETAEAAIVPEDETAEQQAEREAVEAEIAEGRRYIEDVAAAHPIAEGAPAVTIRWSEHPAFYSWDDDALKLSIDAAEIILRHYDEQRAEQNAAEGRGGYDKTKFLIEYAGADRERSTYEGRYDLGDNDGGLIAHIRAFGESHREPGYFHDEEAAREICALADLLENYTAAGRVVSVTVAPWLENAVQARREAEKAQFADTLAAVDMLTDAQLAAAVLYTPYDDPGKRDVARFFLQQLHTRDEGKALAVFKAWRAGEGIDALDDLF